MPDESIRLVHASGECEIDLARRELRILGLAVPVGGRAFEVIEVLARSAGNVVTKTELMDRIWPGAIVTENTLQVHAMAVRKALGPHRSLLKTESGRGYRLLGEWTERRQDAPRPPVGLQRMRIDGASPATNFPASMTRLIGRRAAVARLRDLLSAYRVVTLTGPGGIGKTSLALKAARGIVGNFADGAWLVELASLSDPDLVPSAVAGALGFKLSGEISAESVARAIGAKHLLLVLDNCEHVIDAAADLSERLTRLCPHTTILVTSREVLQIDGEAVYRVAPLDVPALGQETPHHILGHSAVALFITRINALDAGFSPRAAELASIAAVCRHLDGIPLAIEFAAASAATLGIAAVATGLRDRFALLTSGRRTALAHQRTLRTTLDWSHTLLPEAEQLLFRRLAVFQGGFTLDAAVAVMADTRLTAAMVTSRIANLIAKSLVALDTSRGATRWYLLETIRTYALLKLAEHNEADTAARLHATYYNDFSLSIATDVASGVVSDVAAHAREIDNVRAALDWSFSAAGDVAIGIALTAAYVPVWLHSVLLVECRERCETALGQLDRQPTINARLRLQLQLGFGLAAAYTMQPVDNARSALENALDIAQSLNDVDGQLSAIYGLWGVHYFSGETRAAFSRAERLSEIASSIGEPYDLLIATRLIGSTLHHQGDQRGAQAYLERVIEQPATSATRTRRRSSFFPQADQRVSARADLSRVVLLRGYPDRAVALARTSLEEAVATGSELIVCQALRLGVCHAGLMIGDLVAAERDIARLVDLANALNAPRWISAGRCFEGKLLIAQGSFESGSKILRSEFDTCERTGWTSWYPEFLGAYAEGLAGLGRFPEALAAIDQALAKADQGGERYYVAELLRLKGEFLLAQPDGEPAAAVDDCFGTALMVAQQQGAMLFALRAALSMARWRVRQARPGEARQVLTPVYDRFTEGFDTADVRAAKALLDELRG